MEYFGNSMAALIDSLARLPGIGRKSAQRLAFYIIQMPPEEVEEMAHAMVDARTGIHYCK